MTSVVKAVSSLGMFVGIFFAFSHGVSIQDEKRPGEWRHFGYDQTNNKFSPLDEIDGASVIRLKKAWTFEDKDGGSGIFFNPLIVKGRMIALMPSKKLVALDPLSGGILWEFSPDTTDVVTWSKGITYHEGKNGRPDALLFVFGSTLYSVNAATGKLNAFFGHGGRVDFYTGLAVPDSMRSRVHVTSNAPGVIFGDLFITGCKVPDELPSVSGDVRAFNVNSGNLEWVFKTIPEGGEFGSDTWPKDARKRNGGANCWAGMALDEQRGIVYVPTASPSFDFYGADREGQNLFANCLLALDAKTGKRIWHFQTTHHDLWDRDNGSPPNLVTVVHKGKRTDAVALVTKLGYVFLFDRATGKPLFPIEEIPVPTVSEMPGEKPWPTQPRPLKPAPFVRQGFRREYVKNIGEEGKLFVEQQLANGQLDTGIYAPPSLRGAVMLPSAHGGANWGGASVNPATGVLFVNASDLPWFLKMTEIKKFEAANGKSGEVLFQTYCSACHGKDLLGTAFGPDLTDRKKRLTPSQLEMIIRKGAEPMPSFQHLPSAQIESIVGFLAGISTSNSTEGRKEDAAKEPYGFSGYHFFTDPLGNFAIDPPFGTLTAIDLLSGETLWQVPLGHDRKMSLANGKSSGLYNRGGGIATAGGLIFIAATGDRMFRAFDQNTGKVMWETELPGNGYAVPATYAIGKKQFITIAVSPRNATGFKGGYITFALD
jgi:quinoprotein glucose dehydrogenase